ncbi:MAG: hypothetical protein ACK5HR_01460 [Mycoplasmatales bacterium]
MEFNTIEIININEEVKIEFEKEDFELIIGSGDEEMIKKFYNTIYDNILENKKLVKFKMNEGITNNIFKEILEILIEGLNKEIKDSEKNITKILEHKRELQN